MKKPRKKLIWILAGGLILAPVGFVGVNLMMAGRVYAEAKAIGMPLEPDSVYPTPAPAPEDNAALLVAEAWELSQKLPIDVPDDIRRALSSSSPAPRESGLAEIDRAEPVFAILERAARKPEARLDLDWGMTDDTGLSSIQDSKEMGELMIARAIAHRLRGDHSASLRDMQLALRLIRVPGSVPLFYAFLVRANLERQWLAEAVALSNVLTSQDELDELHGVVMEELGDIRLADYMDGGIALNASFARRLSMGDLTRLEKLTTTPIPGGTHRSGPPKSAAVRSQFDEYLSLWMPIYRLKKPERDNETLAAFFEEASSERRKRPGYVPMRLKHLLSPRLEYVSLLKKREVQKDIALSHIEVHRHRLAHGTLPDALPVAREDRFRPGHTLQYKRSGAGFSIWSVGEDGADDKGALSPGHNFGGRPDIVSRYP